MVGSFRVKNVLLFPLQLVGAVVGGILVLVLFGVVYAVLAGTSMSQPTGKENDIYLHA